VEAFEACLRARSKWTEARLNLGIAYWKLGDAAAARRTFEEVVAAEPNSVDALRGLAALALESDDQQAALDLHSRLIDLGERGPELYYNAGLLQQRKGGMQEAVRHYRRAVEQQPDFAEAFLNLGHALRALGQEEEAKSCWQKALEFKPELAHGYFEPATMA